VQSYHCSENWINLEVVYEGEWFRFFKWKDGPPGQFTAEQRICIKSVLINVSNGDRGPDFVNCAIEPFVAVDYIIDASGDILIDSDGTFITFP